MICLHVREPIDDGNAYHFAARSAAMSTVYGRSTWSIDLWLIVQRRHERHDRSPSAARVVLQLSELPDVPTAVTPPLVTRILGHYEGFSGQALLVRWTHRVDADGLELSAWPAACTAHRP